MDPLVEKFFLNAHLGIVNAIPDSDEVLRKATLIFPYQDSKEGIHYFSSIFLELVKEYYSVANENVKVEKEFIVLEDAVVPKLAEETKDPLVELVDLSFLKDKIHAVSQKQYDDNLRK
ncbi:adenylate and guanylate cyclase catalytic domain protein, partial [Plakobranchus ocellatus]